MRVSPFCSIALAALALSACGGSSSETAASDTTATAGGAAPAAAAAEAPADAASPTASIVVLYNEPKDTAAFEKYYAETHLPLLASHAQEIGVTRRVFTKFDRTADGKKAPYYREAQLWFASEDALKKGMGTEGFKAVAGDLPKFVTNGGPTILISRETNK